MRRQASAARNSSRRAAGSIVKSSTSFRADISTRSARCSATGFRPGAWDLNISYDLGTSAAEASVARARIQLNQIDVQLRQLELAGHERYQQCGGAGAEHGRARAGGAVSTRPGAAAARCRKQQVRRRDVDELSSSPGAARSGQRRSTTNCRRCWPTGVR